MDYFIESIFIKKIRHLENIKIDISSDKKKHLIITGKNGSGKTTVLYNLSQYLKSIEDDFYSRLENNYSQWAENALNTYNKLLAQGKSSYDHEVTRAREEFEKWNSRIEKYSNGLNVNIKNKNFVESAYKKNEFIIAYFDAKRSTSINVSKNIKSIELKDKFGISENIDNIFLDYLVFLKTQQSFANNEGDLEEVHKIQKWFDRFEVALRQILEDDTIKLKFNYKDLTFKIYQQNRDPYGFEVLSDGYSAILDILINLILRMEKHISNTYDLQGIVLIDELETHLHINLQKNILKFLSEFFPNIQFIVTTHSPFIINSIDNVVIYDLENLQRFEDLSSYPYESVVEGYFNINTYSQTLKEKLYKYKELVYKSDLSEDEKELEYELQKELKHASNNLTPDLSIEFYKIYHDRKSNLLEKTKAVLGDQFDQMFEDSNEIDNYIDIN